MHNKIKEIKIIKCDVCNSDSYKKFASENGYHYFKCNKCGLVYVNPNQIGRHEYYGQEDRIWMSIFENADRKKFFIKELKFIDRLTKNRHGKLLDIGCGEGEFLELAKKDWWHVKGIEPTHSDFEKCKEKKLDVIYGYFPKKFYDSKERFDAVTMFDVLEHMRNPKAALKTVHELLKPDGVLLVRVPNPNYVILKKNIDKIFRLKRKIGKEATYFNPGSHIFYFYPKTIRKLISDNGFKIVKMKYERSEIFKDKKIRIFAGMLHYAAKILYFVTLGRVNCMINTIVYTRKIEDTK